MEPQKGFRDGYVVGLSEGMLVTGETEGQLVGLLLGGTVGKLDGKAVGLKTNKNDFHF